MLGDAVQSDTGISDNLQILTFCILDPAPVSDFHRLSLGTEFTLSSGVLRAVEAPHAASTATHVSFCSVVNCPFVLLQGQPENVDAAKQSLLKRAKANSDAQLGKYDPSTESADAGERTFEKGYVY